MQHKSRATDISRRSLVEAGLLSWLGLDVLGLANLRQRVNASEAVGTRQHRNSCVFIFLFGGPSHIDLWDMKPEAPREIRGDFSPIATSTAGIQICEHLPALAVQMDKLCLVRSMTHHMNVHGPACSELYSGREYFGPPMTDQATPEDWPSVAALATRFGVPRSAVPQAVVLPWYTQFVGQDRRIAGQTGGRMGEEFNPFLIDGNPADSQFEIQGLCLPGDVTRQRFEQRRSLLKKLEQSSGQLPRGGSVTRFAQHSHSAGDLIAQGRIGKSLRLDDEPASLRERYGTTRIGQSLLLSRRLVEAGVPLVTVNWDDDYKDDKVSPHWDTHVDNFPKLKNRLCPPFDRGLAAFVEDLHERGLLETTLVVAVGEFGRTPLIGTVTQNNMTRPTGRDHWPHAFTAVLAGGGIRGGQVYGRTTTNGGYVDADPVAPADLAATILRHLGIDPSLEYDDRILGIRQRLCVGRPITDLG